MTLRARLMVAFAYVLLLAVVALSVPLGINMARRARADFAVELTNRADAVAAAAPAGLAAGPDVLHALVREEPAVGRVIVTDAEGSLVADSTKRRRLGRDYRYRPEIVEALEGQSTRLVRNYPNVGLQYVVAVPVVADGRVVGAVRVNEPVAAVDARVRRSLLGLGGLSLLIVVVALVISAGLAQSLTRPLRRLAAVASQIGEGRGVRAAEAGPQEVVDVAAALNAMSDRIEQTLAAQTDFVANASHQLRTPLTGLRLRLEALAVSGDARAAPMLAETDRLAGLVDDLLTLVRAGTAPDDKAETDLADAIVAAVDRWSIAADETGQAVIAGDVSREARVVASTNDVAMVLDNLISNAVKYTPPGTVVTVAATVRSGIVELSVADDGPGMISEDRQRAFKRFYRGSGGGTAPGTGLGLAIVREIARRWGGDADIRASNGTTVLVTLPRAESAGAGTSPHPRVPAPG